ncbi:MAG: hypothetical protein ACKVHO_09160 [Verrucomicrobiia bacterium]
MSSDNSIRLTPGFHLKAVADVSPLKPPVSDIVNPENRQAKINPGALICLGATADRFDARFPTDASLAEDVRKRSPNAVIATDKPSWGETTVGAALGVYDTQGLSQSLSTKP